MTACESCKREIDPTRAIQIRVTVLDARDKARRLCVPCWITPGAGRDPRINTAVTPPLATNAGMTKTGVQSGAR
jgi:hypothetical protein